MHCPEGIGHNDRVDVVGAMAVLLMEDVSDAGSLVVGDSYGAAELDCELETSLEALLWCRRIHVDQCVGMARARYYVSGDRHFEMLHDLVAAMRGRPVPSQKASGFAGAREAVTCDSK
jgi:hypothetical protein